MRTSDVAVLLVSVWALWGVHDMQQQPPRPPAPLATRPLVNVTAQPIPDRQDLSYWPGP